MAEKKVFKSREEWLANRKNGIGGSEISAVVGQNPHMTNTELWRIKTGRADSADISGAPYVRYGIEAEKYLRSLFALDYPQYHVHYDENNSWINPRYPWAQASLDGWVNDGLEFGVLEIKTTEIMRAGQYDEWKGRIPQNYYCQLIFYMAVVEADFGILKAQIKHSYPDEWIETRHYRIERMDVLGDMNYLMKKGEEFWGYVERDECPPLILPNASREWY